MITLFALVLLALCVASFAVVAVGSVTAVVLVALVATARTEQPATAEVLAPRVDDDTLARLVVLRAFLIGRSAGGGRRQDKVRSVALVRLEDPAIADPEAPRDTVWRALFYALVLAEVDRQANPGIWRKTAKKLGARLAPHDPYPLYLRLVEATPAPRADGELAAGAIGVTAAEIDRHRRFLYEQPIARWW